MERFKNGTLALVLLILLSGCQYMGPVTKYKKNLESQNIIESLKSENYFDEGRWDIDYVCFSGLPCINGGFWTTISYDQENKVFKMQGDNIIIEQFKQTNIIEKYSIDYLFNNYLFSSDTNYIGARLWWLLESNNMEYRINPINSKLMLDAAGSEKINGIYCTRIPTNNNIENWLKDNKNLEQVDYVDLFENSNCILNLYIDTKVTKETTSQLDEKISVWLENNKVVIKFI